VPPAEGLARTSLYSRHVTQRSKALWFPKNMNAVQAMAESTMRVILKPCHNLLRLFKLQFQMTLARQ
jgi:hypothetical protein